MAGNKWKKALKLGCIQFPRTLDHDAHHNYDVIHNIGRSSSSSSAIDGHLRVSDAGVSRSPSSALPSPISEPSRLPSPMTPQPSRHGLVRFTRSSSDTSAKKTCAICLSTIIPGQGHAIFTAECSHSFHFNCITTNVKHGNRLCPVCRTKWKEIPFQSGTAAPDIKVRSRDDAWRALQQQPAPVSDRTHFHVTEPEIFDDDDLIEQQLPTHIEESPKEASAVISIRRVGIRLCPEVPAIPKFDSYDDFAVLVHLKSPAAGCSNSRAPVDLVTVLDISGSMAGTKLALLKRAMGFVIQHLGSNDRLSVVAFSATARRLFPLRRMTDSGRHQALQAVNSLSANGGTNIAEGLKRGAKVMLDRKCKNPVSSIILLSDGQDTYTITGSTAGVTAYQSLLPRSVQQNSGTNFHIPVHTFGFGADHDAVLMHSISESSGGTFSFIEAESVIQDAFAQCMGGFLSVVVQELKVFVKCLHSTVQLTSIKAGSYQAQLAGDAKTGTINVGHMYAEEERDFLVLMDIPQASIDEMPLLSVSCAYEDTITSQAITSEGYELKIDRPNTGGQLVKSTEVDKHRNRLRAAGAMSEARALAERGDLTGAISILDKCRQMLSQSPSAQAGDPLCVGLGKELREMEERMCNRQVYEASGRAYVLSGMSSHSWQRANARGDTTSSTTLSQVYQTTIMADMITRSQTMALGAAHPTPPVRPPSSLIERPRPR